MGLAASRSPSDFIHLHVHSHFSFCDGAASPKRLLGRAAELGMGALALTDHQGLYGAIRFYQAAQKIGIKPIIGAELLVAPVSGAKSPIPSKLNKSKEGTDEAFHLILLAQDLEGYRNLCRLISETQVGLDLASLALDSDSGAFAGGASHLADAGSGANRRAERSAFHRSREAVCSLETLARYSSRLIALSGCASGEAPAHILSDRARSIKAAKELGGIFDDRFYIELQNDRTPPARRRTAALAELARELNLPTVATNNVHYLVREEARLHDLLAAYGDRRALDRRGARTNSELYLKSAEEMAALFKAYPEAVRNTARIAEECSLDLGLGRFHFPSFPVPDGETPYSNLCALCFEGAKERYRPLTPEVLRRLEHELSVVDQMGFAEYFLIVKEIVDFAKSRGIYCSGRGSAGDSIISYVLGITDVDPVAENLLFERFLNPERREMPDIDIDFCSRRRDEIIEFIYKRYGRDRVAMVATVATVTARSAVRVAAKAMGSSPTEINRLARHVPRISAGRIREALAAYPELEGSPLQGERDLFLQLVEGLEACPTHLGTHLGGFIIAPGPITDFVPLQWAAKGVVVAQYDKDDIGDLGLVKMDILGLRMHSAIAETVRLIKERTGEEIEPYRLPQDNPAAYRLIQSTRTVGLFQLESSGQRNLAARLQERTFSDIVAAISLYRPGPLEAEMIAPFIRRRHRKERALVCHPALVPILRETYGVILYQEQVLEIAAAVAGFSLGEADSLRRAMTKDKSRDEMEQIGETFIRRSVGRGVSRSAAEEIFRQLKGFASYGFNKAHAASFAVLSYASAWLKAHYPAEFLCAINNNQPMGFYSPRVVLNDARHFKLEVLPLDINASSAEFSVEREGRAIRVGFSYVRGMSRTAIEEILGARTDGGPFISFEDFCLRVRINRPILENLVRVGAFDSLEPDHRASSLWSRVQTELEILGLSVSAHPLSFYREALEQLGVTSSSKLNEIRNNSMVKVAGLFERRQSPPTKSGQRTVFLTLEDEDGLLDVVVFEKKLPQYGKVIAEASAFLVVGRVQNSLERGRAVLAEEVYDLRGDLRGQVFNSLFSSSGGEEAQGETQKRSPAVPPPLDFAIGSEGLGWSMVRSR